MSDRSKEAKRLRKGFSSGFAAGTRRHPGDATHAQRTRSVESLQSDAHAVRRQYGGQRRQSASAQGSE